ncbi:unnamed protein product [Ostreobium quekettii]|uniref:Uncharacterized protein n=1 Tax=Ostreobium quekettii TaxID=121088 RepID=A0A8S1IN70_9CHLO|nr:unnamed protein product [Ostreobium quekettii]
MVGKEGRQGQCPLHADGVLKVANAWRLCKTTMEVPWVLAFLPPVALLPHARVPCVVVQCNVLLNSHRCNHLHNDAYCCAELPTKFSANPAGGAVLKDQRQDVGPELPSPHLYQMRPEASTLLSFLAAHVQVIPKCVYV